ncbi:hypothetical protein LCGC14_1914120 [marine sediment metagenome]|uniref:Uncharacterized protein n=1 Tax=marine sediment metagenome TaxID=412755 RepID=A0A0F9FSJ4_9ZZZZ
MAKELYTITVPAILADLVGRQNLRENIEKATKEIFSDWASPELIKRIKVTKPRNKREGGDNG